MRALRLTGHGASFVFALTSSFLLPFSSQIFCVFVGSPTASLTRVLLACIAAIQAAKEYLPIIQALNAQSTKFVAGGGKLQLQRQLGERNGQLTLIRWICYRISFLSHHVTATGCVANPLTTSLAVGLDLLCTGFLVI